MNNNRENIQASINHKKHMPCLFHKVVFSLKNTTTIDQNNPRHVLSKPPMTTLPPYQYDL
jgi:hypothetical protein